MYKSISCITLLVVLLTVCSVALGKTCAPTGIRRDSTSPETTFETTLSDESPSVDFYQIYSFGVNFTYSLLLTSLDEINLDSNGKMGDPQSTVPLWNLPFTSNLTGFSLTCTNSSAFSSLVLRQELPNHNSTVIHQTIELSNYTFSSSSVQYLSFTWNYYVQQNGMNRSHILAEDLQNHTTITFAEAFYQTGTANAGSKDSKIVPVLAYDHKYKVLRLLVPQVTSGRYTVNTKMGVKSYYGMGNVTFPEMTSVKGVGFPLWVCLTLIGIYMCCFFLWVGWEVIKNLMKMVRGKKNR